MRSTIRLATGGDLERGPSCDLCTPDAHYELRCGGCGREWDEPCSPGEFRCPACGRREEVTGEEDDRWCRDVLGL